MITNVQRANGLGQSVGDREELKRWFAEAHASACVPCSGLECDQIADRWIRGVQQRERGTTYLTAAGALPDAGTLLIEFAGRKVVRTSFVSEPATTPAGARLIGLEIT